LWIASKPNAFIVTLFMGLVAGFFLGARAVTASNAAGSSMIAFAIFGAIVGAVLARRFDRADRSRECDPPRSTRRLPAVLPPSAPDRERASQSSEGEVAEAALRSLGYGVREARTAVASAIATLDDDADASAIVKTALRARRA